jgi:hypothetical protein
MMAGPGASEGAALNLVKGLREPGLWNAVGRAVSAIPGGVIAGAPFGKPMEGGITGGVGGAVSELGQFAGRRGADYVSGKVEGRMEKLLNKVGEITGLGKLVNKGSEVPSMIGGLPDRYYKEIHEPIRAEVDSAWPADGVQSPVMQRLLEEGHASSMPKSVQDAWATREELKSQLLKMTPKQKAAFMQTPAAQVLNEPMKFTFDEMEKTAMLLNREGYHTVEGTPRGGAASPEARSDAHAVVGDIVDIVDQGLRNPDLAGRYKTSREHAHGVEAFTRAIQDSEYTAGRRPDMGKVQLHYWRNMGDMKTGFGPRQQELAQIVSPVGFASMDQSHQLYGHVSGNPLAATAHAFLSMIPPYTARNPLPTVTRQNLIGQLLQYGIPAAAVGQFTGPPAQQED